MKKLLLSLGLTTLLMQTALFSAASTSTSTTQNLTMTINSASNITTSGNPGTMSVTLNTAGTGSASDNSTTYTVTSNTGATGSLKVTGMITTGGAMPTNTTLSINLASNSGTSAGVQSLSTTAVNLVTSLPTLLSDTAAITYTFSVTNGWTVAAQTLSRTVTLTLTTS